VTVTLMTSFATACRSPELRARDVILARAARAFALGIAGTFVLASAKAAQPNAGAKAAQPRRPNAALHVL